MNHEAKNLLQAVAGANTIVWFSSAIPNREDEQCCRLIECLRSGPRVDWVDIFARDHLSTRIQLFAFRMTQLSVRKGSLPLLETAAVALAMEGCREREPYSLLALVRHSAAMLGVDGDELIRRVIFFGDSHGRERLQSFIDAEASAKTIESMGFKQDDTADGFSYRFDVSVAMPQLPRK